MYLCHLKLQIEITCFAMFQLVLQVVGSYVLPVVELDQQSALMPSVVRLLEGVATCEC